MNLDFDYIVVGSGFGGSVMTCRLAEKGYKVCLLERGRQWKMNEFPRRPHEIQQSLLWSPEERKFGLMEFRDSPESDIASVSASGLGGGSLIYANVLLKMPPEFFHGWPEGYTREEMDPYYDQVLKMMEAQPYPFETENYYKQTPKTAAFKKAAQATAAPTEDKIAQEFIFPPLAIRFEGDFPGHQSVNAHGALQSKCNKCGECDIGCNIHAKNTLDLNYLFRAQNLKDTPAEIRTHAEVIRIEYHNTHYTVTYIVPEFPEEQITLSAKNVVLSAGAVGSTSLLLKMKKYDHLPRLNKWLGKKLCGNGDLVGVILDTNENCEPTNGPVITGAIKYSYTNYPDGFSHGAYIEDAGFPIGLGWYLSGKVPQIDSLLGAIKLVWQNIKKFILKTLRISQKNEKINIGPDFAKMIDRADFVRRSFGLLGMGRDRNDGEILLRDDNQVVLHWKLEQSDLHFSRVKEEMQKLADSMGGTYIDNPLSYLDKVITVHPLGGCPMGATAEQGFVKPTGEVYGYEGLYVVDASILPTSLGSNPALTIAAIAEKVAEQIPVKFDQSRIKTSTKTPEVVS